MKKHFLGNTSKKVCSLSMWWSWTRSRSLRVLGCVAVPAWTLFAQGVVHAKHPTYGYEVKVGSFVAWPLLAKVCGSTRAWCRNRYAYVYTLYILAAIFVGVLNVAH